MIADRYEPTGASITGGMGEVIECRDLHLDRQVILKILRTGEEERRLLDEQKALLQLRSKHVVQLFDVVEVPSLAGKQKALVLEHIAGKNLDEGTHSQDENFLKVLWQIACGLADIHAADIIHRDIKPNNIRVDTQGVVKIIDFGLSRQSGPSAKTRGIIGTPRFMAPELWSAKTIAFDASIDVYALAVTVLTCLNVAMPQELDDQPPSPIKTGSLSSLLSALPPDIVRLLESSLSHAPCHRPKMADIRNALSRHLLRERHRALLVSGAVIRELDTNNRTVSLKLGSVGNIVVSYDGHSFKIENVTGVVSINNMPVTAGFEMTGCCVIAFGTSPGPRGFATFDVSNPEVMP